MVDRQPITARTAVGALESIPDKDISFGKCNTCPIYGPDQLDQAHHSRDFQLNSTAVANRSLGVFDDFNLAFGDETDRPFPADQIKERVVGI